MLVISSVQIETLRQAARRSFDNEMVAHLGGFSPPLVKAIGEDQLHRVIDFGVVRAGSHGFTHRGPVRLYLELMLLFGSHFDTDPQYPWAAEILAGADPDSQMRHAGQLYEQALDYRSKVAGPDDAYTLEALSKISLLASQPLDLSWQGFVPEMLQELAFVYPQKAAYVDNQRLESLILEGIESARTHRFATLRGAALMVVLMLAFGHGCANDPLYPWIGRTLHKQIIADPEMRAKRLEHKALTWLKHVLAHFESGAQA